MIKIKTKCNFARSTNVKIDYNDNRLLDNIILSNKFQQRFIDVVNSLSDDSSNQRSHIIAGTPGTGKSTFAVFLAKSISVNGKKIVGSLIKKQAVSKEFRQLRQNNNFCLPVFLHGNEGEIEDAFYSALKEAFFRHGWQKQFELLSAECSIQALGIIANWQKNYPNKYQELTVIVEGKYGTIRKFTESLQKNRRCAQKIFPQLYRQVTGGATIGSSNHGQVIRLYERAIGFLQDNTKYNGIFIIYDEFGKYLEYGVRCPHNFNLHFLQDMAEACNKSGSKHMHLLLITHLPMSQYATQLSSTVRQQWQKIEGRFQQLSFNSGNESNYEIISSVFDSNASRCHNKLRAIVGKWQKQNDNLFVSKCNINILLNCYPLHPLVVILLPLLTEKIAQNERTMFSFITRNEEFSLPSYLQKTTLVANKLQWMPLIDFFSYFYPLLSFSSSGKQKVLIDRVLADVSEGSPCAKDIIVILIIATITNNRTFLKINKQSASSLLCGMYSSAEVDKTLDYLRKNKLIVFDRARNIFSLDEGATIDISEEISKVRQRTLTHERYTQILRANFPLSFVTPKRYNFCNGITRYYREHLLSIEELERGKYQVDYSKEDGAIFYIVPFSRADICHVEKILQRVSLPSVLFVITNEPLAITAELTELQAIEQLYSRKDLLSDSATIKEEIDHHRRISCLLIERSLLKLRSYSQMDASVYYLGKKTKIAGLSRLSQLASKVCAREYLHYPIFYNEMLNRHKASVPTIQGRGRFIKAYGHYLSQRQKEFVVEGGGPDFAIYTALLRDNTLIKTDGQLKLTPESTLVPLFADFCSLLRNSEQTVVQLTELINRWQKPPFGVRLSLFPLYISIFIKLTPSPVSFFYDGIYLTKIDSDLFEGLIRHPKKYSMKMVVVDSAKRDYLRKLGEKFTACLPVALRSAPSIDFAGVAKAVSQFYSLIPSYSRRHESLTVRIKKLIAILNTFCQPEEFLLNDLPEIYRKKNFSQLKYSEKQLFLQDLGGDLAVLFNQYVNLIKRLAQAQEISLYKLQSSTGVTVVKNISRGAPLAKHWKNFIQSLPSDVQKFPFSTVTLRFVNRIIQFNEDASNQVVVENIADALTGANPKNWSDKGEALFNFNLQRSVIEIEEVSYLLTGSTTNITRISNINSNKHEPVVYEIVQSELNHEKHDKVLNSLYQHLAHLPDAEKNSILLALIKLINNKELLSPSKVSDEVSIGKSWG